MGDVKNLKHQQAIAKVKELAEDKICHFCTHENENIVSRPMSTQRVDEDGTMWFLSRKLSASNMQIGANHRVYLMYLDDGRQNYLSISGTAEILHDRAKIDEFWSPIVKAWFKEGKDDPEITLIKVKPEEGHYWDTKHGKLVAMIKIAAAVIAGREMDDGIEGDLNL
jgi:general stress protein 26